MDEIKKAFENVSDAEKKFEKAIKKVGGKTTVSVSSYARKEIHIFQGLNRMAKNLGCELSFEPFVNEQYTASFIFDGIKFFQIVEPKAQKKKVKDANYFKWGN